MRFMRLTGKIPAIRFSQWLPLLAVAVALASACLTVQARQNSLPPISAPGQIGPKPPVGSGGCSTTAPSCADVAPTIIHSATGPSPLGRNVHLLAAMLAGSDKGADLDRRVAQWAVAAFRKAGVDSVRVENYPAMARSPSETRASNSRSRVTENVVAVIRGRTKANEFVILGAALGARDSQTTLLDAACNTALVIDAARAIHAAGVRPLRSIRFVLLGGKKQGMAGARAYVHAHRAGMDRADAVVIYDAGNGPVSGYDLEGRKSLEAPLRKALAPAAQFGAGHDTYAPAKGNAAFRFLLTGVPTIVTNPPGQSRAWQTVDLPALKRHVALAALTAYGIADLPERLGTRLARPQIEQLLNGTVLKTEMKMAGARSTRDQGQGGQGH